MYGEVPAETTLLRSYNEKEGLINGQADPLDALFIATDVALSSVISRFYTTNLKPHTVVSDSLEEESISIGLVSKLLGA